MGIYGYTPKEHSMLKNLYAEANNLFGVECIYYAPLKVDKDTSNDPFITLDEGVKINVIFEEQPKAKLKSLNWYSHDTDELPLLVYISEVNPVNDGSVLKISEYGRILVPYELKEHGAQLFQIDKVKGDSLNVLLWTCSLVPCTSQVDLNPSTPEIDTSLPEGESSLGFDYIKWR